MSKQLLLQSIRESNFSTCVAESSSYESFDATMSVFC